MMGYSTFPKGLQLKPYHQMQFSVIPRLPFYLREGIVLPLSREGDCGAMVIVIENGHGNQSPIPG